MVDVVVLVVDVVVLVVDVVDVVVLVVDVVVLVVGTVVDEVVVEVVVLGGGIGCVQLAAITIAEVATIPNVARVVRCCRPNMNEIPLWWPELPTRCPMYVLGKVVDGRIPRRR